MSPTAPGDAAAPTSATPEPVSATPAGADEDVAAAAEALDDLFADSADVLEGLASYRYTTTFSYSGGEAGVPGAGSIEVRGTVASADRQSMTWKDFESGDEFSIIRVGTRAWMRDEESWNEVPEMVADAMSQGVLVFAPVAGWSQMAEGLETSSDFVGIETVNGVAARHYTSTYREWSERWSDDAVDAEGDVWIAEEGYPVRFRLSADITDEEGNRSQIVWSMELTDVNSPLVVDPPQE